jgi:hypothetical protein
MSENPPSPDEDKRGTMLMGEGNRRLNFFVNALKTTEGSKRE